ncbi:hypothetical protein BDV96DRAFT_604711 [Lophiotrema nucula]|uniref:NAD(P)-binding protein n=1 Tax=Lophiotrema nucula TaxID=690887 RepID=A0A6A5YQT2_9PLEO|nr:hypothetical protein BDV96DRAFT_604711 [Lophiotrema nucula]
MAQQSFDPDQFTKMGQLTPTYHRDVYPAIDPKGKADGKVVLITGASRGLGKNLARVWAEAGASGIIVTARDAANLKETEADVKNANSKTEVLALTLDVRNPAAYDSAFQQIKQKFGKLDVVIANAGVVSQGDSAFPKIGDDADPEKWWTDFETNTRGTFLTAHHFIKTFGGNGGTFIVITSGAATVTIPGLSAYSISKLDGVRIAEYLDVENPELRAFSLDPGIIKGVATMDAFKPFAYDTPELIAAFTIWLSGSETAGKLKGSFLSVTWDVEELEKYASEIVEKGLLKTKFLGAHAATIPEHQYAAILPRHMHAQMQIQQAFPPLPNELFLQVLDTIANNFGHDGGYNQRIAIPPSDLVTKTLRALTLTSRTIYLLASEYLYSRCLYLDNCRSYSRFRRTFGLHLGNHPDALEYGQAGRNEALFAQAQISRHITSLFLSPHKSEKCGRNTPMIRLAQIIDLCNVVAPTLKKLALDMQPVYAPTSEVRLLSPHVKENNIFLGMTQLEELVCSFDTMDYFPYPPLNLKRLAITMQGLTDIMKTFVFSIPSLEQLIFLRPEEFEASEINEWFDKVRGRHHLDIVLVDVNANHRTPEGTRDWTPEDRVRVWEVDVPKSYYGDADDLELCDGWIWNHAVAGTLWTQAKRRMECWSEIQGRIGGEPAP